MVNNKQESSGSERLEPLSAETYIREFHRSMRGRLLTMSYASRIEIAAFDDLDALIGLLEKIEEPTDEVDPDFTRYLVVWDEDRKEIIGCAGLELFTGTALLKPFAIDPNYQETELGTTLVKRVIDEAFESGSEALYVCASKMPEFFWENEFNGIDLDDVPGEIRDSKLFIKDCPQVAAYVRKRVI